jgi:hypothetical protein
VGVCQSCSDAVIFFEWEYLRLVREPPYGSGKKNAVKVALESCAPFRFKFCFSR